MPGNRNALEERTLRLAFDEVARGHMDILVKNGKPDGAILLGALENLANSPVHWLHAFMRDGRLECDEFDRFVLFLGGPSHNFRCAFTYDEATTLNVHELTKADGAPILAQDFPPAPPLARRTCR